MLHTSRESIESKLKAKHRGKEKNSDALIHSEAPRLILRNSSAASRHATILVKCDTMCIMAANVLFKLGDHSGQPTMEKTGGK